MLLYDSRKLEYKAPFGAVKTHQGVTINFPVNRSVNVTGVFVIIRKEDLSRRINLPFSHEKDGYNVFSTTFSLEEAGIHYYRFEIETPTGIIFVGKTDDGKAIAGDWLPEWQLTVYEDSYATPEWLKGGIIYHAFADRFARKESPVRPEYGVFKEWTEELTIRDEDGVYRANDFYGGNAMGIVEKLPYLHKLGVTAIYLSPVFESHSNHRYDTADYSKIDPMFGTEQEFETLINTAKEYGISIILDGVFNHTGADSIYFNKFNRYDNLGAYQSKESPYHSWFTFTDFPDEYACWWGITVVPTVRRDAVGFHDLITAENGIIDKWTKKGVRGWRLDVVDELSTEFVRKIRKACKRNGDITVIGEVWEDASTKESYGEKRSYFLGKELDGVMNYPYKEAIIELMTGGNVRDFINKIYEIAENYPKCSLDSSMTLLGTHDTVRIMNALSGARTPESKIDRLHYRLNREEYNRGKSRLKIASLLQYFLPGVPTVYYGDEIGMQGYEDPINRRAYPTNGGDSEILTHYQKLGAIRSVHREDFMDGMNLYVENELLVIERGDVKALINLTQKTQILDALVYCEYAKASVNLISPMSFAIVNKNTNI